MSRGNQHIQKLIARYVSGGASIDDLKQLGQWLRQSSDNKQLFSSLKKEAETEAKGQISGDWARFEARYGKQLQAKPKRRLSIGLISMAASVAIILAISSYLFLFNNNDDTSLKQYAVNTEIHPENITLDLSDGTNIPLEKKHATIEIDQDGGSIIIENEKEIKTESKKRNTKPNTLRVPFGKTAHLTLADGTKVSLNAGSQLIFPDNFEDKDKREVMLIGEGYFDVTHNASKPFKVLTNDITFTVLGTSFNISSYPDQTDVSAVLVTGSLQVENNVFLNKQKVILKPGEKSSYSIAQKHLDVSQVNTNFYTSWKDGYLTLEKNSIANLVKQIERFYNVDIVTDPSLLSKPSQLTGKLLLEDNPKLVYQAFCDLTDLNFQMDGNRIVLSEK
jgi:ferric-dicitrate binding protein FerR (iron transport regulator)